MRGNVPDPPAPRRARANQKDPWQTRVNLYLKHRDVQAAKTGDDTQPDQNGGGIGGTRFHIACSSDRMVPGVEQVPKGLGIVHVKELREVSTRNDTCRETDIRWKRMLPVMREIGQMPTRKRADDL
jgi:hypothetical protein